MSRSRADFFLVLAPPSGKEVPIPQVRYFQAPDALDQNDRIKRRSAVTTRISYSRVTVTKVNDELLSLTDLKQYHGCKIKKSFREEKLIVARLADPDGTLLEFSSSALYERCLRRELIQSSS